MTIRFDGQVAVVTGGGAGLGREYSLLLAALGARVVVNDLGAALDGSGTAVPAAESVAAEIRALGGEAHANSDSVTDPAGAQRMMDQAVEVFGGLDVLICNAGILRDKTLMKMTEDDFRKVLDVHLVGSYLCVQAAAAAMIARGYGRIVLTTSQSGLYGTFGQTNYCAAKLALVGFANAAKLELGRKGVQINSIAPSALTRMTEDMLDEEHRLALDPAYVAPMVAYLASRDCTLNGEVIAAGAKHFAVNRIVQGPGVTFGTAEAPDVDGIAARIDRIMALEGAAPYASSPDHVARLMQEWRRANG